MKTMRWLAPAYNGSKGSCAPIALRQITDASDNDILSACIFHGYDTVNGGLSPASFKRAGEQLGVKFGGFWNPKKPTVLSEVVALSGEHQKTIVVGTTDHVLVVRNGEVLDTANTPPLEPVVLIAPVLNDPRGGAK